MAPRYEMFRRMTPGAILVVHSGSYDEAVVFGENVVIGVRAKGCAGIVADGGVRDVDSIRAMGAEIPVFARFATPVSSAGRWRYVELEVPVVMPGQTTAGVAVKPGDWMVGDGDGVMVVPAAFAADVAADARRLHAIEEGFRPRLLAGEDPQQVYGSVRKFDHVRRHRT
jgi:regulator of RNase E activity RraA